MRAIITLLNKWKYPLLLGCVLSLIYLHSFENRVFIEFEIEVTEPSWFTIYWAGEDQGYSKWREVRTRLTPEKKHYTFYGMDLRDVTRLRIDTHDYPGTAVLRNLIFKQHSYQPVTFTTSADFSHLKPISQIESYSLEGNKLSLLSTDTDPQLELFIHLHKAESRLGIISIHIASIFLLLLLFFYFSERYRNEKEFIPLFFAVALGLIIVMASTTAENIHPDEYVHLDAGDYYRNNWLPPAVDDPAIVHSYSVYGVSRLNSREVAYIFIGKVAEVVSTLNVSRLISLRTFNVLLFAFILLYLLKNPPARLMAAPLLLSPQFWYVFSYCNSDAFALAITFVTACEIALPRSFLNRFLANEENGRGFFRWMILGVLCGLLFLLKKNFLFFVVFLGGYLLWRILFIVSGERRKQYLKRLTAVVALGLALTGCRIGADYAVNGMDRDVKIEQIHEKLADVLYKPSTPIDDQHIFLHRRARGDMLTTIIVVDRWFEKTYRSAFGLYGYFTAAGTDSYYNAVRTAGIALLGLLVLAVLFRGGVSGNVLLLYFLICSAALIATTLYMSWTDDFQTQGRYFFPIVPMACIVLHHFRNLMQGALFKTLITAMFLLSVYSFVFVGLLQLSKLG